MATWLNACTDNSPENDDNRCEALKICRTISASLSLIGCLLALVVILVYKKFRFLTQRLVMYLLLPCTFMALFSLHNISGNTSVCSAKGFFRNFFALSQNFWIICINVHLLTVLIMRSKYRHLEKIYHSVVWGGAFLVSLIPLFGNHYGNAGIWCWIQGHTKYENVLRVICYYMWLLIMIFGGALIYIFIIFKVLQRVNSYEGTYSPENEQSKQQYKKSIRPLLFYPIINVLLASVPIANRIHNWSHPGHPNFGLSLAHSITSPLFGFVNACLFLLNKDTLIQLHPVNFWNALCIWSKSTFTFARSSAEPKAKNLDYTMKDQMPTLSKISGNDESVADME